MEERTGWRRQDESQIVREKKWQTCWCCRDQQRACRMVQASAEKLKHTGLAEKKEWPRCHRKSSWRVRQSRFFQNKKKQSHLPKHQIVRRESLKVSKSRTFARERGIRAEAWRGKGKLYSAERQVPKRRGRACKKSLPMGSRRKYERVSGRKSSSGQSAESWFHSMSSQT